MSQWLYAGMTKAGLAVELIETRHLRVAFKTMPVKTDKKDARGIAQLMRLGCFRSGCGLWRKGISRHFEPACFQILLHQPFRQEDHAPFPTRPPGAEVSRDPAAQIHIQADIRTTLVVFWTVEAPSSPVNPTSEPRTGSEHYTMPSGLRFAVYYRETSFLLPVRSIILASWQLIVRRICVVRALSSKPSKLGLRQPRWVQSRKIARKAARPI